MTDSSFYVPGYSGSLFTGDKLRIFSESAVTVIAGWPRILAWKKTRSKPQWSHFRPTIRITVGGLVVDVRRRRRDHVLDERPWSLMHHGHVSQLLLFPSTVQARDYELVRACNMLGSTIPHEVRSAVSAFSMRQWHLLALLARCGSAALDLVRSNPALAFALASNWVFHKPPVSRPLRSARTLLEKKQREILDWLGFPGTEATRRILAKIPASSISIDGLLYLRTFLNGDGNDTKYLMHLPRLNFDVLRMITDPVLAPNVSFALLEEAGRNQAGDAKNSVVSTMFDILQMAEVLGCRHRIPVFRSLGHMEAVHDELTDEVSRRPYLSHSMQFPRELPPSPLPTPSNLVPLDTPELLIEEGQVQQNCVASYAQRIVARTTYVYRMTRPERATLSIVLRRGRWAIGEIRGFRNRDVLSETHVAARNWLSDAQESHRRISRVTDVV